MRQAFTWVDACMHIKQSSASQDQDRPKCVLNSHLQDAIAYDAAFSMIGLDS